MLFTIIKKDNVIIINTYMKQNLHKYYIMYECVCADGWWLEKIDVL